jgi:predicted dehydrogenase
MDKVKLGFVGMGFMGSIHLENASKIENAVVGGVCDLNAELANVMIYASHVGEPIDLPLDGGDYAGLLKQYVSHSQG